MGIVGRPRQLDREAEAEEEREDGVELAVTCEMKEFRQPIVELGPAFIGRVTEAPHAVSQKHSEHREAAE